MNLFSNEQLSAFIDNELSEQDMQSVRAALAQSSELQQRLEQLQQADNMAQLFFAQQDDTPVPSSLLALINNHQPDATTAGDDNDDNKVTHIQRAQSKQKKEQQSSGWSVSQVWGMAASVLFVSVLAWQFFMPNTAHYSQLDQALFALSSGNVQILDEHTRLELRWSELNSSNELCRHFVLHTPSSSKAQTACWQGENWHYQNSQGVGEYQPASAQDDQTPKHALSADEEARWLKQLDQPLR